MEDMYGKADPRPLPPSYTAEDLKKMALAEEQSLLEDRMHTREGISTNRQIALIYICYACWYVHRYHLISVGRITIMSNCSSFVNIYTLMHISGFVRQRMVKAYPGDTILYTLC